MGYWHGYCLGDMGNHVSATVRQDRLGTTSRWCATYVDAIATVLFFRTMIDILPATRPGNIGSPPGGAAATGVPPFYATTLKGQIPAVKKS